MAGQVRRGGVDGGGREGVIAMVMAMAIVVGWSWVLGVGCWYWCGRCAIAMFI